MPEQQNTEYKSIWKNEYLKIPIKRAKRELVPFSECEEFI
jgi:hypothetical protein